MKRVQELQKYLEILVTTKDGLNNDKWCAPHSTPLNAKTQACFSDLTATSLGPTVSGNTHILSLSLASGQHLLFLQQSLPTAQ